MPHGSGSSDAQAGFLIGASIHDVAQAIGGGYAFSDAAGTSATIVKLARVALLAPVVALVGLLLKPEDGSDTRIWRRLALPWFIVAFFAMVTAEQQRADPRRGTRRSVDRVEGAAAARGDRDRDADADGPVARNGMARDGSGRRGVGDQLCGRRWRSLSG